MKHSIAMFKNDRRENDKQPEYKGWNKETGDSIAAWVKTASNGSKYFSIVFETKEAEPSNSDHQAPPSAPVASNEDIPW